MTPTPDGEPVRSRVPRRTVATDAEHERLVELLVRARLVTSDDDTVELAHESLARAWPRLQTWLDDDVEGQRILRHLALAADAWDGMGRPDSELYRGVRLAQALEWQTRANPDLTPTERALPRRQRRTGTSRGRDRPSSGCVSRRVRTAGCERCSPASPCCSSSPSSPACSPSGRRTGPTAPRSPPTPAASAPRRCSSTTSTTRCCSPSEGVRLDDSIDTRSNLLAALSRSPELIAIDSRRRTAVRSPSR